MAVFYDLDMFKKSVQPKSHKSFSTWPDPKICQRLVNSCIQLRLPTALKAARTQNQPAVQEH